MGSTSHCIVRVEGQTHHLVLTPREQFTKHLPSMRGREPCAVFCLSPRARPATARPQRQLPGLLEEGARWERGLGQSWSTSHRPSGSFTPSVDQSRGTHFLTSVYQEPHCPGRDAAPGGIADVRPFRAEGRPVLSCGPPRSWPNPQHRSKFSRSTRAGRVIHPRECGQCAQHRIHTAGSSRQPKRGQEGGICPGGCQARVKSQSC